MIERVPPRYRPALAVSLLVLAVFGVVGVLWLPFWLVDRQRMELAALEGRIAELTARAPLRDRLMEEERDLSLRGQEDGALLEGETAAVAAARIQSDLVALASEKGLTVSSVQFIEPEPDPPFTRVGLRLSLSGTIAAIRDLLYAIETHSPVLLIDALNLAAPDLPQDAPDTATELSAAIQVRGWLRPPLPQAATRPPRLAPG